MTGLSPESPHVTYQDWSLNYRKRRFEEYGEVEARRRYEAREGFWVLLGDPASPDIVFEVQINRYAVKVAFLDSLRRDTTTYLFIPGRLDHPDLMLLGQHHQFTYISDDPAEAVRPATAQGTIYKPDGTWYRATDNTGEPYIETRGQLAAEQLPLLVEPFPAFGDWAGVTRPRQFPAAE